MVLGADYREYVDRFRAGTTKPYQAHDAVFMREVAEALKTLPRIFLDFCRDDYPASRPGWRMAVGCLMSGAAAGGRSCRSLSGSPAPTCVGIYVEPYSIDLARQLIVERGLTDRGEVVAQSVDQSARTAPTTFLWPALSSPHELASGRRGYASRTPAAR